MRAICDARHLQNNFSRTKSASTGEGRGAHSQHARAAQLRRALKTSPRQAFD